jgi:hypothetical protein
MMGQTKIGATKIAAKKIGISYEEYLQKRENNLKWCHDCKKWKKEKEFGRDKSRGDGLDARCYDCRYEYKYRSKVKGFPGKRQLEKMLQKGLSYCKDCKKYLPIEDIDTSQYLLCKKHTEKRRLIKYEKYKQWLQTEKGYNSKRKSRAKKFLKAYIIYGMNCDHCGEKDFRLFEFHHKNGNPGRKEDHTSLLGRIIRNKKPLSDIELLCSNCHILANIKNGTKGNQNNKLIMKLIKNEVISNADE